MDNDAKLGIGVEVSGVAEAERQLDAVNNKLKDTETATEGAGKSGDSFFSGFLGGAAKLGMAVTGIGAVAGGVASLASGMVSGNAEFERYQTQFGVLLKSSDAAKQRLDELAKFGASTPFELPELVRADKVLTAFGLDSENTAKQFGVSGAQIRTTIGDVAAGTGASFEELSVTFGKFASGATGDAIARFQELGIATKKEMADWGLQFSNTGQLLTPTDKAFTILEQHVREKFGGMMDAQSKTFEGMMGNMQDWIGQATRTLAAPIFDKLKDGMSGLLNFLSSPEVMSTLTNVASLVADGIGQAFTFIGGVMDTVGPIIGNIVSYFQAVVTDGDALNDMLTHLPEPIQPIIQFFGQLISNIQLFIASIQGGESPVQAFIDLLTNNFGALGDLFGNVVTMIGNALPGIIAQLGQWGQAFISWIGPQIPGILSALGGFLGSVLGWIFGTALPGLIDALGTWAKAFTDWLGPQLPVMWNNLVAFGGQIWDWLINTGLPTLLSNLAQWGQAFVDWIGPRIGPALEALGGMLLQIGGWLIGTALPTIISKLAEWGWAFISWVGPQIPPLLGKLGELLVSLGNWLLTTALPAIITKLGEWGGAFLNWVAKDVLPKLPGVLQTILTTIGGWIGGAVSWVIGQMVQIGQGIVTGITNGLGGLLEAVKNAVIGALNGAIDAVVNFFKGGSPMMVWAHQVGEPIGQGVTVGAKSALSGLGGVLSGALNKEMGRTVALQTGLSVAGSASVGSSAVGSTAGVSVGGVGGLAVSGGGTTIQVFVEDPTGDFIPVTAKRVKVMSNALGQMRNIRMARASG